MPQVSRLFIDKMTLVYDIAATGGFVEHMRHLQNDDQFHINWLGGNYQNRGYRYAWHVVLQSPRYSAYVLIIAGPYRNLDAPYLSIEWNPNNLGYEGQLAFWWTMQEVLQADFVSFLEEAIITRVDLAIDITPLSVDSLLMYAKRMRRSDPITGEHGVLESIRLGSRHSSLSFLFYQRQPQTGHSTSSHRFTTRIEATVKPFITFRQLHSAQLSNPFLRLSILRNIDPVELDQAPYTLKWLLDSARLRGIQGALLLIDSDRDRSRHREWLSTHLQPDWYTPETIWQGYHAAMQVLGLDEYFGPPRWQRVNTADGEMRIRRRQRSIA